VAQRTTAIAVRTGLIYLILAGWWFFASDNLLSVILAGPGNLTDIQQYKLGLFLVTTALLLYVLGGETLRRRPAGPAPGWVATLLVPGVALALLAVGITGSWYWAFQEHMALQGQESRRALAHTAAVQAARVGDWIERRTAEARSAAEDPLLGLEVSRWLAQGAPRGETRDRLARRLASLRHAYPYEAVFLLDANARTLISTDAEGQLSAQDREFARQALAESRVLFAGVHRRPRGGIELDIVTPLLAGVPELPRAILYYRIDPKRAIAPLLGAGAGAMAGQESLLLRREGNAIIYLSWLRFRPDAPLPLRVMPKPESAEGRLLRAGRQDLAEGADYRGVPVVAAAREVPGTDWYLLTKADAAAMAAPVSRGGWVVWGVVTALLAVAAGTMALWWYQQRARERTRSLSEELERETWRAQALQREARLAALFDLAADAVFVHDRKGRILEANEQAARSLGFSRAELCSMNVADVDLECRPGRPDGPWSTMRPGDTATVAGLHRRKDGSTFPVEARLALIHGPEDDFFIATVRDVTAQRAAEQSMRLYGKVFEASGEAIMVTDAANRIVSVNKAFSEVTGYEAAEVLGQDPRMFASGRHDAEFYRRMWESLNSTGHWRGELWNLRKNGEVFPELAHISVVRDAQGVAINHIAVFSDISERKAAESRISYLAQHDILTRLPNRTLMHDRLSQAIANAQRSRDHVALLFADLDRFKNVNDSLGHHVGDLLLQAVSERLLHCVRRGDTVSRVGGDEFILILPGIREAAAAAQVARKALQSLSRPYLLEGHEVSITPSIGISVHPEDGPDIDTLVRNADAAMYEAKQRGRGQFQFFTSDMNARAMERIQLEAALRRVLEEDRLALHYQPQLDIPSGRVVAIEALLRWQDPELASVPTPRLITIAEECGLIATLSDRVLRRACLQARQWEADGLGMAIAVNISALHLRQPGFRERVSDILRETGLAPSRLELEVTESALLENAESTRALTDELAALGLELVIDDFGSGYSSLAVLEGFRVHKLKIYQSLLRAVPGNPQSEAMVKAILGLGTSLGLRVLAEGVENEAQLDFLKQHGCHEAQGYLFARPLPPEEFPNWMRARRAA
jgi:diguanylate cyclase (GGDEF)-like protein/PAS domain S-box-containing protein